jgi:hypothetical protein
MALPSLKNEGSMSRGDSGGSRGLASLLWRGALVILPAMPIHAHQQLRLRLRWTLRIAIAGLLAGMATSPRLWIGVHRLYPRAPMVPLAEIPLAAEVALLLLVVAGLVLGWTERSRSRAAIGVALIALALLVAADQSRLQPWVYEYALVLAVLGSAAASADDQYRALKVCRSLLVALYFWGAVQKMNVSFVTRTWLEFVGVPARHAPWLQSLGWAPPLVELGIALTLASRRLRRAGVAGAVLLHGANVALLLASGENSVVWAWNAAMAASVIALFAGEDLPMPKASGKRLRLPEWGVLALAWVMPALSFLGLWDSYLSAALYSGNTLQAVIVISQASVAALPKVIQRNTWQQTAPAFIDLNRWSYDELNVPAYPAERVLRRVALQACRAYLPPPGGTLLLLGRPDWLNGHRERTAYECAKE